MRPNGCSIPEFNSITEPIPSFTMSSSIISISPKRIDTGSWTSIRTARFDPSSDSVLLSDVSIQRFLSSATVAGHCERFAHGIRLGSRLQLAFAGDLDNYRRVLPLIEYKRVTDLQGQ